MQGHVKIQGHADSGMHNDPRTHKDLGMCKDSGVCVESGIHKNSVIHRKRDVQTLEHRASLDAQTLIYRDSGHAQTGIHRHWVAEARDMQKLKYIQGQRCACTKRQGSGTQRDKDVKAGEYRLGDTPRWEYTDTETQRLRGCTTQGYIRNGTQKLTDLQGTKDMQILDHNIQLKPQAPEYRDTGTQKPWETKIYRHWNITKKLIMQILRYT